MSCLLTPKHTVARVRIKVLLAIMLGLLLPSSAFGSAESISSALSNCKSDLLCLEKTIGQAKSFPELKSNFELYLKLVRKDPKMFEACHTISHEVGKIAWERYQGNGFIKGVVTCQYGFAHGYMFGMSNNVKGDRFIESGKKVCESITLSSEKNLCYHGIGHGAASAYATFKSSIESCLLIKEPAYQNECVTGAAMERANSVANFPTLFKNQIALCQNTKIKGNETLLRSCLSQVLTYKLYLYDQVVTLEKNCNSSSKDIISGCYEAMGYVSATYLLPKLDNLKAKVSMAYRVCQKDKTGWCLHSTIERTYSLSDQKIIPLAICNAQKGVVAADCKDIVRKLSS